MGAISFDEVRRKFSKSMGQLIPPHGFAEVAKEADSRGRFQNRQILDLLILLYNYLESKEDERLFTNQDLQSAA